MSTAFDLIAFGKLWAYGCGRELDTDRQPRRRIVSCPDPIVELKNGDLVVTPRAEAPLSLLVRERLLRARHAIGRIGKTQGFGSE